MKKGNFKNLVLIFSIISFCLVFFFAGIFAFPFSRANSNISIDESNGVSIYVNGEYVVKNADGTYSVTKDSSVTIIAINEYKIFKKLLISDGATTTEVDNNYRMNLTTSSKISISASSIAASENDKGNLFANPYLIDDSLDLSALSDIFAYKDGEDVTDQLVASFKRFLNIEEGSISHDKAKEYRNSLIGKYYRVIDDILLSQDEFYGIGNSINPFIGCFDFLNNNIIINVSSSNYESMFNNATNEMDIGLFGSITSSTTQPSIIRNANVKGSISINGNHTDSSAVINAGGVAGKIDENVILRNVNSAVSVSVSDNCSINIGGVFGTLSTPIESKANIVYSGANASLNANSKGAGSNVNAGFLCGLLDNVYCNDFLSTTTSSRIITNLTNDVNGNCNAAGVIGKITNVDGDYNELTISNILVKTKGEFIVSSTINNSKGSNVNYANAAGAYGNIECDSKKTIIIDPVFIDKVDDSIDSDNSEIKISASATSSESFGNAYAGGLFGYLDAANSNQVSFSKSFGTSDKIIFCNDLEVIATQNGYSQAYAGGIFAYNAYEFFDFSEKVKFILNPDNHSISIKAIQTTTAKNKNDDEYHPPVCAGFFSSYLPYNYSIKNLEVDISNGSVLATREIGSVASGSIYAGTIAGYAEGNNDGKSSFSNIVINLTDTSIEASCLSYVSKAATTKLISATGQNTDNLAVGSFIGHLKGYGSDNLDLNNNISSNAPGVENVEVNITLKNFSESKSVINGVQNVDIVSDDRAKDNVSEGYVGGFIGYLEHSFIKNVSVTCTNTDKKAIIRGAGNNKPNTAAVGGLIGETYLGAPSGIDGCSAKNLRIYGTAFYYNSNDVNIGDTYDLYVGGIIGVAGYDGKGKVLIKDSYVIDSRVESFGERLMLPYAGGIAGGIWWGGTKNGKIYNCSVINSLIYSKSVRSQAYSAGVTAMLQRGIIDSCNIINTLVRSATENTQKNTYSAGIVSRTRNNTNEITNCFSNALVTYEGPKENKIKSGIYINGIDGGTVQTCSNNHYNPFNVGHTIEEDVNSLYGALNVTEKNGAITFSIVSGSTSNCIPIAIDIKSNKIYNSSQLTTSNKSFSPYTKSLAKGVNTSNASLSIELSNDKYAVLNNNVCTLKDGITNEQGTVYVNLKIRINLLGKEYLLGSMPVYINATPDRDYTIIDNESEKEITEDDVSNYVSGNNYNYNGKLYEYKYIRIDVANDNSISQAIKINFAPYNAPKFNLYTIRNNDNLNPTIHEGRENGLENYGFDETSLSWILNNKVDINDPDSIYYSDYIFITKEINFINISSVEFLSHRIIAVVELYDSFVIVDFIPNYVTGITIGISSNTPSLEYDKVNDEYVYAPGDTILFEARMIHNNGTIRNYNKSIIFEEVNDSNYVLSTNGRMTIRSGAKNGTEIIVTARYIGEANISDVAPYSIKIRVKTSIDFDYTNRGCDFDSTRKIVRGSPFSFVLTPSYGYGFDPEKLIITIDGVAYNLTDPTNSSRIKPLDSSTVSKDYQGVVTIGEYTFNYSYSASNGAYTITIPENLLTSEVSTVNIEAEFPVVYQLVFDRGQSFKSYNERYFIYSIKANSRLNPTLREVIGDSIYIERFGFVLKGYYLTDVGSKIESYGSAFSDLCNSNAEVLGPLNFYARWTYDVAIEKPDGVTINSALPLSSLETSSDGESQLIPININNDFTFHFETESSFAGTPDFQVFIVKGNKTKGIYQYTDVTSECVYDAVDDMYSLNKDLIDGLIYIKVFTSSINLSHGETEETLLVNPNVYSDNTYTISYALNYSKKGISRDNAALGSGKEITFTFSKPLPTGTTLQLYRHVNKIPVDIGRLVLQSNKSSILLSDFVDISLSGDKDVGSLLEQSQFDIIYSELYYIVVTPPLYYDYTNGNDIMENCSVSVQVNYTDPNEIDQVYYNTDSKNYLEQNDRPEYDKDNVLYNIYRGKTIKISQTGSVLSVAVNEAVQNDNVVENRHNGKVLLWCVEAPNGTQYQLTDGITPTCSTDVAHYFLVNGNFDISFVTSGYKIKLIETDDVINPSADVVVWEMTK